MSSSFIYGLTSFYLYIQSQGFILHSSDFLYQLPFSRVLLPFPSSTPSFFPWWNILWMSSIVLGSVLFLFTPFLADRLLSCTFHMEFQWVSLILHSLTGSIFISTAPASPELPIQVCIHPIHLPKSSFLPVKLPSLESPFVKLGLKTISPGF